MNEVLLLRSCAPYSCWLWLPAGEEGRATAPSWLYTLLSVRYTTCIDSPWGVGITRPLRVTSARAPSEAAQESLPGRCAIGRAAGCAVHGRLPAQLLLLPPPLPLLPPLLS
jgi:hypothetical protein|eukprot:COSAG01_NODE_888_length_12915_cov_10.708723_8_plen_111_part_00